MKHPSKQRTEPYPLLRAALAEYRELLGIAMTWTDDPDQAQAMVERYFQGRLQAEQIAQEYGR